MTENNRKLECVCGCKAKQWYDSLSVGLLQQGAPELWACDRMHKQQFSISSGQTVIHHHINPFPELPELTPNNKQELERNKQSTVTYTNWIPNIATVAYLVLIKNEQRFKAEHIGRALPLRSVVQYSESVTSCPDRNIPPSHKPEPISSFPSKSENTQTFWKNTSITVCRNRLGFGGTLNLSLIYF